MKQPASAGATDVASLIEALAGPVDNAAKLLADPELARILQTLSELTGAAVFEEFGKEAEERAAQAKSILHDKVEGIVLAFVSLVSAYSSQEKLQARVAQATGTFSAVDTESRLQAVLGQYDGVAAMVGAADETGWSALRDRLTGLNTSFQVYTGSLVRDLAVTEVALATLGVSDLQKQWEQIKASLSKVDFTAANEATALIAAEIDKLKGLFSGGAGFTMDQYKEAIQKGLGDLNELIGKFDPSMVVQAIQNVFKTILSPLQKLEDFKAQVETIVRGALGTIREAVEKINLKPLTDTVKQALATLSSSLTQVAALLNDVRNTIQGALDTVKKALEGVKTFVLDPQDGLKKKIEDVFGSITGVLDALNIKDVVNEVTSLLQPVNEALAKIEFQPVVKAVLDAIGAITDVLKTVGPLLVTDALKQKLGEAAAFLNQIDFGEIGDEITGTFDEILTSVDEDTLGEFQAEYNKVVETLRNFDPEPSLQEVQKEVFDPLLAELEKVHPADLLKPVNEAFDSAHQALAKFNPSDTFSFMTEFFQNLLAKIDEISPAKMLEPVEKMLDDLRQKIEALLHIDAIVAGYQTFKGWVQPAVNGMDLFGPILDGLNEGHGHLKDAIEGFDGSAFTKFIANFLDGALSRLGAVVNASGLSAALAAIAAGPGEAGAKLAEMQKAMDDCASRIGGLDAPAALTALRGHYSDVKAAASARTGIALPDDITALIGALDPMPVLAPILPKIDRVKTAAAAKAAQFGQLTAPLAAILDSLSSAISLMQSLLSPATILRDVLLAPIQGLFPEQKFAGPKDVLLNFLNQLNPADLRSSLEPLFNTLESKLKALVEDAVLNPVGEAVQTIRGATDILNIHSLVDAINGVFKDVEDVIKALDPAPLIEEIDGDYQQIVGMLDKVNPADFIQEIAKIYDEDIVGVIRQISPETLLLPPLRDLFQKISEALGAFDLEAIFKPVLDRLKGLDSDLGGGLHEIEASWQEMLGVLASASGGSASVSVSAKAA